MNNTNNLIALEQLKQNWKWYLALGAGLVALGTLALMFSATTTFFSVMYLGIFLVIIGGFEAAQSFRINKWSSFALHLLLSVLYVIAGFFIALNPTLNALSLTLLLAIFFVVSGVARIIFSYTSHSPYRGWLLLNGILTLILGILVWYQWPLSGFWVIGAFVGIDAIFTGWTWIALSLAAHNLAKNNSAH
jgi:uncharacterized membrane protein HdeD (DUF308 family)